MSTLVSMPVTYQNDSDITNGPKHFFKLLLFSRYLKKPLRNLIDPILKRNSYQAHPKILLFAMIYNERPAIKQVALRKNKEN